MAQEPTGNGENETSNGDGGSTAEESTPERLEGEERTALPGNGAVGSAWQQNLLTRFAVGVPLLLVVLLVIAVAPQRLVALAVAAAGVYGTYEYVRLLQRGIGLRLPMGPMLFAAGAIGLGGLVGVTAALSAGLLLGMVLVIWALWFAAPAESDAGLRDVGLALAGLLLVPWLLNHLGLLAQLPGGRGFLAFLIVTLTLNDTLAYLVGTFLGNWPLMPSVSPNKTVEGAVGGVAGGAVAGIVARFWMGHEPLALSVLTLVLLGGVLAAVGQMGDLLESKLKRLNDADETGHFLPGHGGLLDRVDAYLLAAPLAFYMAAWLGA